MNDCSNLLFKRLDSLRGVLRQRSFRLFSIGNFMSLTAIWVVRITMAWLIWELTKSKTWLGMLAFAELGPSVLISLYSGPLADRVDKFSILRMGQWLQVMLALAFGGMILAGLLTVPAMIAVMIGFSIIGGLTLPARLAIAPSLVDKPNLATASALGSITLNLTRMIAPLIAAPILLASAEAWAFILAAFGFLANALCLTAIGPGEAGAMPMKAAAPEEAGYGAMFRFMRSDRNLFALLVFQAALWLVLRPLMDMLPAFADLNFQAAETGYSILAGAVGLGAVGGALYVIGRSEEDGMRRVVLLGAVVAAVAMVVFALTTSLVFGAFAIAVYGAAVTAAGVAGTTYVQMQSPRDKLGRIMSLYSLIFRFAPAAGAMIFGYAADQLGLGNVTVAFAAISLVAVAIYSVVMSPVAVDRGR